MKIKLLFLPNHNVTGATMANNTVILTLQKEVENGRKALEAYEGRLDSFEKKFRMKSAVFAKKFSSGKLGDREEFFEWYGYLQAVQHWQKKLKDPRSAL